MITETEAYIGPNDLASHASKGRTPRTEVMFGPAGHAYIYLIYGRYHCLNIVTEKIDCPAAVLIRGGYLNLALDHDTIISPRSWGNNSENITGPGRLCRYLKIDKGLNKEDLVTGHQLWLEDTGVEIGLNQIKKTPRIGIDYAGKYKDKLWRFVLEFSNNDKRDNTKEI